MKNSLFILFFLLSSLFAQDVVLKGRVKHANTHEPVADVNVFIKTRPVGTVTDENGSFTLPVQNSNKYLQIVFNHIAYDTLQVTLEKALKEKEFFLVPNLIRTKEIIVEAQKSKSEFAKDLPQSLTIIDASEFEGKGYIDVGDLLRTDQSVQIEEDLSGRKVISMRGGNPEDVVVFYNGIKMNNNYDNVFDLSLLNIEDIKQVEIIKGSNTALFGAEAFSGVINIIPKIQQNYTARFIQKFGSYDSGDWNLQLNHNFKKRWYVSYNQKRAGTKRPFVEEDEFLKNNTIHHSANLIYDLSNESQNIHNNNISVMYMDASLDYENTRLFETINDRNRIVSLRFTGNIGPVKRINSVLGYQELNNSQEISSTRGLFEREFLNDNYYFNIEKVFDFTNTSILTSYQFETGKLNYEEDRTFLDSTPLGLQSAILERQKHGFVAIVKTQTPTGSDFLETATIDGSYRYDSIEDTQEDVIQRNRFNELEYVPGIFKKNDWQAQTIKFSTLLKGGSKETNYSIFISTGSNIKFPTMFHQLSSPSSFDPDQPFVIANLNPEKNKSTEVGLEITKETPTVKTIDGWQVKINYFSNLYENKFRAYYVPDVPIAFFDNVPNAKISGIEFNGESFLFGNRLNLEFGVSKYFISEKAAFPFKSDLKFITNVLLNYEGYSLKLHWFRENEQVGWARGLDNRFIEVPLPGFSNIDIHLSKKIEYYAKFIITFSGRNLFNNDTVLEGIAIRDRRFYIGLGIEY